MNFLILILSAHAFDPASTILPTTAPGADKNPAKIELGKQLFFDKRLSTDNSVSCNSCHNVMTSGTDNLQFSKGVGGKLGGRNSPTVFNAAFLSVQFWDGRANSLEDQAKGPIVNPVEMSMKDLNEVVGKLKKIPGYMDSFKKVYGGKDALTIDNVANAIATYERTLITPNSPVDQYLGGNTKALNDSAVRGMKLVQEVGCVTCHMGQHFAGPPMPTGMGFYQKFPLYADASLEKKYGFSKDAGRFEVTKKDADKNMFRVPTWRNIARTAPYFHNGSVKTLDEAVRVMAKTQLNKTLKPTEVKDIVEFLKGLNGEIPKQTEPTLPN